jgi:hypothetical protein
MLKISNSETIPNEKFLNTLIEMGFDKEDSKEALLYTNNKGVNEALEYLSMTPTKRKDYFSEENQEKKKKKEEIALKDSLFSSSVKLKGDTPEKKLAFEEKQRQIDIEKRKKEKREKEEQLKKLRNQLEEDKKKRSEKNLKEVKKEEIKKEENIKENKDEKQECLLQIKFKNGKTLKKEFYSNDTLYTVANFISENSNEKIGDFTINIFPKTQFTSEDFIKITLKEAGLSPKGSIIVQDSNLKGKITKGEGSFKEETKDDNNLIKPILPFPKILPKNKKNKKNKSDSEDDDNVDNDSGSDDDKKIKIDKEDKIKEDKEEDSEVKILLVSTWYLSKKECPEDTEIKIYRKRDYFNDGVKDLDCFIFKKDNSFTNLTFDDNKEQILNGKFSLKSDDSILILECNNKKSNFDLATITNEVLIISPVE